MTGRTITILAVLVLLVIAGFWIFGGDNGNLTRDNATTTDETTGIGGPEEGFDPLEGFDAGNATSATSSDTEDTSGYMDKG